MAAQHILSELSALKPRLKNYGIGQIGLFGSQLRGDNHPDSDLDILLHFDNGKETFQNLIQACEILEAHFPNRKLDIVTANGLSPYIGPFILKEAVYA